MTLGRYTTESDAHKEIGDGKGNVSKAQSSALWAGARRVKPEDRFCYHLSMPGFDGLRVLSFESRRAKEIAQLISNNSGVPTVAPSTREVPAGSNEDETEFVGGVIECRFDAVIFMTGVGARTLIEAARSAGQKDEFLAALRRTQVVVRGPKPSAVMREFSIPVALSVPEPNTWRELVQALDANKEMVPLKAKTIAVQEHGEPSLELYEALRERRADVVPVRVYRWELPEDTTPLQSAVRALADGNIDVVLFTSSVQFVHAARIAEQIGLKTQFSRELNRAVVASIGPVASETLRKNGVAVDFEPSHPKMGFLVKEVAENSAGLIRNKSGARDV